jgi:hypothetical protein
MYMRRCPTSLVMKKMQIKTTMRCFTPVKIATIKETKENKCWQPYGKREFCTQLMGFKSVQPLWKSVWMF